MADNPFGLRAAGPADAAALLAFAIAIYEEDAAQPVSPRKVAVIVDRCVNRQRAIAGIVTGPHGIEASVGATLDEFDYTDETHLMVRWLGVAPAFRRTDRASRLVSYVQWLHDTMGPLSDTPIPVFMPALTTSEQQRKVRLYQRRASEVGALFAFGCLPGRAFSPVRAGTGRTGGKGSSKGAPLVRPTESRTG